MTDFDMILHDMILTRGAESVVRQVLSTDIALLELGRTFAENVTDKQIRFESSRSAYKIAQRNKR